MFGFSLKSLDGRGRLGLLVGGGVAALLALLLFQAPETPADAGEGHGAPAETPAVAPTRENVDPAYHQQVMALRAQASAQPDSLHLLQLARLLQDGHQLEEAADAYRRYLVLEPDDRQAWLDYAHVWAGLKQWDEAAAATEELLARSPDDPSALYNRGAVAANAGDHEAARRWWTRAAAGSDGDLAARARASLAQLDASAAVPSAAAGSTGAPQPSASGLPAGHPPLGGHGQPVLATRPTALAR